MQFKLTQRGQLAAIVLTSTLIPAAFAAPVPAADTDNAAQTQLAPVVVTGQPMQSQYNMPVTNTATRTDTPVINVPQTIQVVPKKLLKDQAAQSLEDAVRNAPGVYVSLGEGNRDQFMIRGIPDKKSFFQDGLRDDTERYRDLYNVAHVDVLQGPAALLFGRGGEGGIINLVTKKPERHKIRHLSLQTGSWGKLRGTADIGGVIGKKGAYRVLAMDEHSNGFRDHFFLRRYGFNPKFSYQLDKSTRLDLSLEYDKAHRFADRGIPSKNGHPVDVERSQFFGDVGRNRIRQRFMAGTFRLTHRFSDNIKLTNAFRITQTKRKYVNAYPSSEICVAGGCTEHGFSLSAGEFTMNGYEHPNKRTGYQDQLEMVVNFNTGFASHKLLTGLEYGFQRGHDSENVAGTGGSKAFTTASLAHPLVSLPVMDTASQFKRDNIAEANELGVYVEDQISLSKRWLAVAGVRFDRFSVGADYYDVHGSKFAHTHNTNTNWSPRLGLIYKPVDNDSLYISYTQTYTPQGANLALSLTSPGPDLLPQKATNYEIGNKLALFNGNLALTAAVFQLVVEDMPIEPVGGGAKFNGGKLRNRGVQLSAIGTITSKWRIAANYAYLDGKYRRATKNIDKGNRVGQVPHHAFSIWSTYAVNKHWGIGAGIEGKSQEWARYRNTISLPGYVVGEAMAYYQTGDYRLQVNVKNLTDKKYYPTANDANQIMPGAPRSVFVSLNVNF